MAYEEAVAATVRQALADAPGIVEKRMFGGMAFMLRGNMVCGVIHDDLILRLGKDSAEEALADSHARPFDFTGKPMTGFVYIEPAGYDSPQAIRRWLDMALAFNKTLPAK